MATTTTLASKSSTAAPFTNVLAVIIGLHLFLWTLIPGLLLTSPPMDVIEGYIWGREWQILTVKHPALPSWIIEGSRVLTGAYGWPVYLASGLFAVATMLLVFALGRDLLGPRRALAGTLLCTGIIVFSWFLPEFNHNIAQLPFWAAIVLCLWRAIERGGLWWLALSLAAAGGMYAKFSTGLLIGIGGLWILADPVARARLKTAGPWLALALFVALLVPLWQGLQAYEFAPFGYAADKSERIAGSFPGFLIFQIGVLAPFAILAAAAGLIGRSRPKDAVKPPIPRRTLAFLATFALGPLALTLLLSLVAGIKGPWAAPMHNLMGLMLVAVTGARLTDRAMKRLQVGALILTVLTPTLQGAAALAIPRFMSDPARALWPMKDIAARMEANWVAATSKPLDIVCGSHWDAGLVAVGASGFPSVLTSFDAFTAPWIKPDRFKASGCLAVWSYKKGETPWQKDRFARFEGGVEAFVWSYREDVAPIMMGYAIIPPGTPLDEFARRR